MRLRTLGALVGTLIAVSAVAGCGASPTLAAPTIIPLALGTPPGAGARSLTVTPDGRTAYVSTDQGISVLDLAARNTLGTVEFGSSSATTLVAAPDGRRVYAVGSQEVVAMGIPGHLLKPLGGRLPAYLGALVLSSDGRRLVQTTTVADAVSVQTLDTATGTLGLAVPLPGVSTAGSLVVTPDGRRAYVSGSSYSPGASSAKLFQVDLDGQTATEVTIPEEKTSGIPIPSSSPANLALSPDGRWLYATTSTGLAVLSTADNTLDRRIVLPIGFGGQIMLVSPDGRYLFSPGSTEVKVTAVDLAEGKIASNSPVREAPPPAPPNPNFPILGPANKFDYQPKAAALSPDGRRLFVLSKVDIAEYDLSAFAD